MGEGFVAGLVTVVTPLTIIVGVNGLLTLLALVTATRLFGVITILVVSNPYSTPEIDILVL